MSDGRQQLTLGVELVNDMILFTWREVKVYHDISGQATTQLTPFQQIIGVDPSSRMVEQANKIVPNTALPGQLKYIQSPAEDLSFLQDNAVDLIISGWHWRLDLSRSPR